MGTTGVPNGYHGCTKWVPRVYQMGTTGVPNGYHGGTTWVRQMALARLVWQFRSSRVQSLIVLSDSKIAPKVSLVFLVLSLAHTVALLPMKQHMSRLSKRVLKGPPVRTRGLLGQWLSLCYSCNVLQANRSTSISICRSIPCQSVVLFHFNPFQFLALFYQ